MIIIYKILIIAGLVALLLDLSKDKQPKRIENSLLS